MSRRGSLDQDEQDVAEIRKALATGNAKELTGASALPPVLCYCTASILMTLVNKFVVSGVDFNMTFLLLAIQLVVCVTCVLLSKQVGLISIRPFDWQNAKAWFPISFMLVSVIYTGSKSLQFLSIPVYTIFKNLTIILIAYGEVIWFGGRVTGLTLISFLLMALSSVVAAYADVSLATSATATSPALGNALPDVSAGLGLLAGVVRELNLRKLGIGYFWMMTNCLSNAAFVLAMRKRIKVTGFSDWETMLYNNLLSIPVLVVFSLLFEDWSGANVSRSFPPETRSLLLLTIAFSGAASVGISYTTAWCIRTTSSTTYSMVGALNKLPVAASGMLFFGDVVTFNSVTAIGLGFVAGIVYAVAKSTQKREDAKMAVGAGLPMNYRGLKT